MRGGLFTELDPQPGIPMELARKAAVSAAGYVLAELPDTPPEVQHSVLRELLYALGLATRPDTEPAEEAAA